jgi:hypothetical protein
MKFAVRLTSSIFAAAALVGCGSRSEDRFSKVAIPDENRVDVEFRRLDKELTGMNYANSASEFAKLKDAYAAEDSSDMNFLDIYTEAVLNIGNVDQMETRNIIQKFATGKPYCEFFQDADSVFPDMSAEKHELDNAFSILKTNLPDINVPKQYVAIVSGFYSNVLCTKSRLGFSLEYYLGANYANYKYVDGLYDYMICNYRRKKLVSDGVFCWLSTEYEFKESAPTLLQKIIYLGKIVYLTSVALPNQDMHTILGYTPDQYEWCCQNEAQMWHYMAEYKHLFSTDRLTVGKYCDPAPSTSFFPQDSPGRSGLFVGYKIIEAYLNANTNVTLQDLMQNNDASEILEMSGYNPK